MKGDAYLAAEGRVITERYMYRPEDLLALQYAIWPGCLVVGTDAELRDITAERVIVDCGLKLCRVWLIAADGYGTTVLYRDRDRGCKLSGRLPG